MWIFTAFLLAEVQVTAGREYIFLFIIYYENNLPSDEGPYLDYIK